MNMRKAVIKLRLNRDWVQQRQAVGGSVMDDILQAYYRGDGEAEVSRQDEYSCTIRTCYESGRIMDLENRLKSVLRGYMGQEPDRSMVQWSIAPVWESEAPAAPADPEVQPGGPDMHSPVEKEPEPEGRGRSKPELPADQSTPREEGRATLAPNQGKTVPDSQPTQAVRSEETEMVDKVMARIDALVGADGFKELAHELARVAPQVLRHNTQDAFARRTYLFMEGDGCGLTTQLELMGELLSALRLFPFSSGKRVTEISGDHKLGEMWNLVEGRSVVRQIISIDLCQWMDKVRTPEFRTFLQRLREEDGRHILVFRIPFVDQDTWGKVLAGLADILTVRMVPIAPHSLSQFRDFAQRLLRERGFSMDQEGWQRFEQRIILEKSDGHFYGLRTIKKVVDEMLYQKHLAAAAGGEEREETVIHAPDVLAGPAALADRRPAMEQLEELIGIDSIRERIEEILNQIEVSRTCGGDLQPSLHMRFVGNPGTGKTTVARILGQLMRERSILSKGQFFEYSGRDFCGQYIGETAPKTAAMCRDAYGSVLFIDEAYSLFRGDKTDRDYGREAIDTLISQMENHRQDFVVIMAGYPDDMEVLMEGNGGLASRMPYVIEFPNYGREELHQIFMSMVRKSFSFEPALEEAARAYFNSLSDGVIESKEFANARFVRNLFERTWAKAASRRQMEPDQPLVLSAGDFRRATEDREFKELQERRKGHVGF